MRVVIAELRQMVDEALKRAGYSIEERSVMSEVLLYAQLRDNSQGVVKLVGDGMRKNKEAGDIRILRETSVSALLDGNSNAGMVVLARATQMALAKVREHGLALVGTNNTSSSTGAIGYYARQIAESGYLGLVFAGSVRTVAPHGSYEPIFGTNPIAVGLPATPRPLVLDMATSAIAWYALVEAALAGHVIPGDVAFDENGNATTDPADAMKGAIRSFDRGHKGAGLSLVVEVLTGPLVGAATAGFGFDDTDWGNLILAIDPGVLLDPNQFELQTAALMATVKGARKLPGVEEILLPGERGDRLAEQRIASGEIEIEDHLLMGLRQAAGEPEQDKANNPDNPMLAG